MQCTGYKTTGIPVISGVCRGELRWEWERRGRDLKGESKWGTGSDVTRIHLFKERQRSSSAMEYFCLKTSETIRQLAMLLFSLVFLFDFIH